MANGLLIIGTPQDWTSSGLGREKRRDRSA